MEVAITNYGSTVVSLRVPDRDGEPKDVVLGYDNLEDYEGGQWFLIIPRIIQALFSAAFPLA